MPRSARKQSDWGMYHIMLRGINRQRIFEDENDRELFLTTLSRACEKSACRLFAWCLMTNHVHLLMQEGKEPIGQTIKRIGTRYVYWYNRKYERIGPLFQDRFKSETVEDDAGFMAVLRYIHMNPVKAGICQQPGDYPYSSFRDYFSDGSLVDSSLILELMDQERFRQYHMESSSEPFMDLPENPAPLLSDEKALQVFTLQCGCASVSDFEQLSRENQLRIFRTLHQAGASLRQISRLTGATVSLVRRAL